MGLKTYGIEDTTVIGGFMYHGIINVYKEKGYTSFDVVAKLRGICGQKKIGHTGTLDPDAEGVLPVCLGKATKVCDMLTDRDKEYRAEMVLGIATDTQDISGQIIAEESLEGITEDQVRSVIGSFVGEIEQIPPMYSALKVNGQKLCDLARKGQTVERKARKITIYDIVIEDISLPQVTMRVKCSKGTYIRTLCHDIGEKLGCYGTLKSLLRTVAAGYELKDSLRLSQLQERKDQGTLEEIVQSVEDVFGAFPVLQTREQADRLLYNGNGIDTSQVEWILQEQLQNVELPPEGWVRMRDSGGRFCGIYEYSREKACYRPVKMFL